MRCVGDVEDGLAGSVDGGAVAGVPFGGGDEPDAGVVVLVVVGVDELVHEGPGVRQRAESLREGWGVLQGLEPRLGVGVVVGHVGA